MTPEQRSERNRAIAELCGWPVNRRRFDGAIMSNVGLPGGWDWYDATRSLDDCKRAEEALGIFLQTRRCGISEWACIVGEYSENDVGPMVKWGTQQTIFAPTEAEARSAAIAAIRDAR